MFVINNQYKVVGVYMLLYYEGIDINIYIDENVAGNL